MAMSKDTCINKLAEFNYIMKDDSLFKNTNTRMSIICMTHGIEWISTVGQAYRKAKYCSECRKKDGNWLDFVKKKKYKILEENSENATFQCELNHEPWTTQKNHIKFTECKVCSGRKIPLEDILTKLKTKEYELMNKEEFKNTRTIGKFKCINNHIWECQIHNVYDNKSGCPECSTNSGEKMCKFILETLYSKRFCRTRNVVEGNLELDMYNEELTLACEYNGIQHYIEDTNYFHKHGGFEEQLDRDNRKKKYCEDKNINLIIVKYDLNTFKRIKDYIIFRLDEFINLGFKDLMYDNDINWEEKEKEYITKDSETKDNIVSMNTSDEDTQTCKDLANSKNGVFKGILRDPTTGRTHGEFTCKNNHTFSKSLADVRRNRWCVDCAVNAPNTHEGIVEKLNNVGIILLSRYINNSSKLSIKCDTCELEYEATWDNLKKREVETYKCCRRCNSSNKKIEEINDKLSKIGFKFNDKVYVDAKTKNRYVCDNGHETIANWNAIKIRENSCKYCKRMAEDE